MDGESLREIWDVRWKLMKSRLTLGNQFGNQDQVFEKEVVERYNLR